MTSLLISPNKSGEKRGDVSECKSQHRHIYVHDDVGGAPQPTVIG